MLYGEMELIYLILRSKFCSLVGLALTVIMVKNKCVS